MAGLVWQLLLLVLLFINYGDRQSMPNIVGLAIFIALSCGLYSCTPPNKVAVVERSTIDSNIEIDRIGGSLVRNVQPGDTLYSIAFAMGLDATEVAQWNEIADTTKLQVGQRVRLTKPVGFATKSTGGIPQQPNQRIVIEPIEQSKTIPTISTSTKESETNSVAKVASPQRSPNTGAIDQWTWPLQGEVVRGFSQAQGQHGIDIQGQAGQAVLATSAGEVVYVGNSLKGYGNLVIIKHNDDFLSAYAHNSEIYVREGERVSSRQRIASVGVNRNRQTALHFQIRKNGQPVNPISYLPKSN